MLVSTILAIYPDTLIPAIDSTGIPRSLLPTFPIRIYIMVILVCDPPYSSGLAPLRRLVIVHSLVSKFAEMTIMSTSVNGLSPGEK